MSASFQGLRQIPTRFPDEPEIRTSAGRRSAPEAPKGRSLDTNDPEMRKALSQYSLMRAINLRAAGRPLDGIEGELSDEIAKRSGKAPIGFYMPLEVMSEQRASVNTTTGAGAVNKYVEYGQFIDLLRAKTLLSTLGTSFLGSPPKSLEELPRPLQVVVGVEVVEYLN